MDSAGKRRETKLADRVAKEIVSIAEGKSGVWERRALVHKLGVSARSNVRMSLLGARGRR
jgi:ribosomal protein S7